MPMYEFLCGQGHLTEQVFHEFNVTIIPCPECGESVVRLMSRRVDFIMNPEDRGGHV